MRHLASVILLLAVLPLGSGADTEYPYCRTIQETWAGVDVESEPLDIEVLKKWTEGNANYTEMYFTGLAHQGEKVRIYAIYSAPIGGKRLPAVLHIHGGGQTVNPRWLKFWNERGYAALTFNWGGKWPNRDKYAIWGRLTQAPRRKAGPWRPNHP